MPLVPRTARALALLPFTAVRFNEMPTMHISGAMHLAHGGGLSSSCAPVTPISVNGVSPSARGEERPQSDKDYVC